MPSWKLAAAAIVVALHCAACCGGVSASHWDGTLNYSVPAIPGDASTGGKVETGATSLAVTLDPYEPWIDNALDDSYCGPGSFTVDLGPSCALSAKVGPSYPYSASVDPGQTCQLYLDGSWTSFVVQSGAVVWSRPGINITLGGAGANLEFEGS